MKKIAIVFIIICIAFSLFVSNIYAAADANFPDGGTADSDVVQARDKVWGSVLTIVQMLAFAAVLFAGLRYMFAAPNGKAEIKKSMGILALGAILVFATTTIVKLVTDVAQEIAH